MGDLAADVMRDMGLADAVRCAGADPIDCLVDHA